MSKSIFTSVFAATALVLGAQAAQSGGCYGSSCRPAPSSCQGSSCYNLVQTPPVYGSVDETYVARPAQTQSRVIPAEYSYETEAVMVHPERQIPRHRPAQYSTVREKVMVSPGGKRWEVTRDAYGNTTGCWVYTPAQYAYQQRTVEVSPASIEYETLPAVYSQRQRKVMVRPTQVVHDTIPAVYETRRRTVQISAGSQQWVPARY